MPCDKRRRKTFNDYEDPTRMPWTPDLVKLENTIREMQECKVCLPVKMHVNGVEIILSPSKLQVSPSKLLSPPGCDVAQPVAWHAAHDEFRKAVDRYFPMTEESSIKEPLEELAMGETGPGSANVSATRNPKTESETQVLESQVAPPDPLRSPTPMPEGDDAECTYTMVEQG